MTDRDPIEKERVCLTYDKDEKGTVTRMGPEVSEVKFDRGVVRYIPNDQLERIKK